MGHHRKYVTKGFVSPSECDITLHRGECAIKLKVAIQSENVSARLLVGVIPVCHTSINCYTTANIRLLLVDYSAMRTFSFINSFE